MRKNNPLRFFYLQSEEDLQGWWAWCGQDGIIKLGSFIAPDNPAWGFKYFQHFAILKYETPEEWSKCWMSFLQIEKLKLLKKPVNKTRISWTFLKD
jgi:hypothetical protein